MHPEGEAKAFSECPLQTAALEFHWPELSTQPPRTARAWRQEQCLAPSCKWPFSCHELLLTMKKTNWYYVLRLLVTPWTNLVPRVHPSPHVCLPETVWGNLEAMVGLVSIWGCLLPQDCGQPGMACGPVAHHLFPFGHLQLTQRTEVFLRMPLPSCGTVNSWKANSLFRFEQMYLRMSTAKNSDFGTVN